MEVLVHILFYAGSLGSVNKRGDGPLVEILLDGRAREVDFEGEGQRAGEWPSVGAMVAP